MNAKRFANSLSLFVCLFVGILAAPSAAQRRPKSTDGYMNYERDFLRAFYPELTGKHYFVTFEWAERFDQPNDNADVVFLVDVGAGAKFEIVGCCYGGSAGWVVGPQAIYSYGEGLGSLELPPLPPPPPKVEPPHPQQYLSSTFVFDSQGNLKRFFGKRQLTRPELDIVSQVRVHPDMTDEELIAAYEKSGATCDIGDRKAFERNLPISKLEQFLGKLKKLRTEFERTEFDARPDDRLSKLGYFDICRVFLQTASKGGAPLEYRADFESRRGELVELHLVPDTSSSR